MLRLAKSRQVRSRSERVVALWDWTGAQLLPCASVYSSHHAGAQWLSSQKWVKIPHIHLGNSTVTRNKQSLLRVFMSTSKFMSCQDGLNIPRSGRKHQFGL